MDRESNFVLSPKESESLSRSIGHDQTSLIARDIWKPKVDIVNGVEYFHDPSRYKLVLADADRPADSKTANTYQGSSDQSRSEKAGTVLADDAPAQDTKAAVTTAISQDAAYLHDATVGPLPAFSAEKIVPQATRAFKAALESGPPMAVWAAPAAGGFVAPAQELYEWNRADRISDQ